MSITEKNYKQSWIENAAYTTAQVGGVVGGVLGLISGKWLAAGILLGVSVIAGSQKRR